MPEICGRGASADAKRIQTMCEKATLPVHHGPFWRRSEKFVILIGTQSNHGYKALAGHIRIMRVLFGSAKLFIGRIFVSTEWFKGSSLATVL